MASPPLRTIDGPKAPLTVGQPSSGIPLDARRHSLARETPLEPHLATEARLGFIIGQIAKLSTRRGLIRFGLWVALGLCVIALVGTRMWVRFISACGAN